VGRKVAKEIGIDLFDDTTYEPERLMYWPSTSRNGELIKKANKGQDYEHLADEIDELRDKRQTLLVEDASLSGENERINELIEFIRKNKFRTLEYDDKLVRKLIQNVTVYENHFVISFKSGIEMEI